MLLLPELVRHSDYLDVVKKKNKKTFKNKYEYHCSSKIIFKYIEQL